MRIHGSTYVHGAQPINSPHRNYAARGTGETTSTGHVDQLDISSEAQLVSRVHDLPGIRSDRVAALRAQIQAGTYETEAKLQGAVERLLDEIA